MKSKICVVCGKEFIPKNPNQKMCNDTHYQVCKNCGKKFVIKSPSEVGRACSRKCGQQLGNAARKKTFKERYGVDNPRKLQQFNRICKYCGKKFETTEPHQLYCGNDYYQCPICGKDVKIKDYSCIGQACSEKCRQAKIKATCLDKYGTTCFFSSEVGKEKIKQSNLEKYGVSNCFHVKEIRDKYEQTLLRKYGVHRPLQNKTIQDRWTSTNIKRYGVKYPMQNDSIKKKSKCTFEQLHGGIGFASDSINRKIQSTNLIKYGFKNPAKNLTVQDKIKKTNLEKYGYTSYNMSPEGISKHVVDSSKLFQYLAFKENPAEYIKSHYTDKPKVSTLCRDLGVTDNPIYYTLLEADCGDLVNQSNISSMEYEVISFLKNSISGIKVEHNCRSVIRPYEIDIYLPEYKFGIECNPTVTHNSSKNDPWGKKIPPSYHKHKTNLAKSAGVRLFHIFGYEWNSKTDIIKSMILYSLRVCRDKIYARKTCVKSIDGNTCKEFLDENHRQGNTSASIRLGLFSTQSDELISVMTFNKLRNSIGRTLRDGSDTYELSRFCSKLNTSVVGGASKLLKYFIEHYEPDKIVSFSDNAHCYGNLYEVLNFRYISTSDPGYVWVKATNDKIYHTRVSCQKKNLRKLFHDDSIDIENKTEKQIMEEHGFVQVFDSGVIRWELDLTTDRCNGGE